jgi:hypothetical protein
LQNMSVYGHKYYWNDELIQVIWCYAE